MAILRYFKGHLRVVALVCALLVVQVFCDLSIPRYTSDIVDVGIQQGGIADAVPDRMRLQSLQALQGAGSADDAALLAQAYEADPADADVVLLRDAWSRGEGRTELADAVARLVAAAEGASDGLAEQVGVSFVRTEYEAIGVDLDAVQMSYLLATGGKMLALTALSLAVAVCVGALASRTGAFVARDLREKVFSNALSLSRADVQRFGAASLITRCTNDVQLVQSVLVMMLRMVMYAPIMGVGAAAMVALTAPGIAWVVAVAVAAVACVVFVLVKCTLPRFRVMQRLVDRLNLVAREGLTGVGVVRAFCREGREEERFEQANADLTATTLFTNRAMSAMSPAMMLVMNATSIAIVWFGAGEVQTGAVQVGDVIAFINYAMQVCMSFMMISMVAVMLPRAQVAADRINEVVDARSQVRDPEPGSAAARPRDGWRGEVRFEDVCLRFDDADADVLHGVSFTARPGTTTAVVGSTGSGKSTLARMVPRFYDATAGRVTVDGVDVRDLPQHELRSLVGYVPQKAVLFSGTVRSNIAFSDPAMPLERVRAAADAACATEFVLAKPEGFDAPIAQGGSNVSGGQRQRLSIARAVAAEPRVFVFDDAFSALDLATDAAVRANLKSVAADATVLVVAQRIATVVDADQIVVLDEGRVAGVGTHLELMETCPAYREIALSQLTQGELDQIARGAETRKGERR